MANVQRHADGKFECMGNTLQVRDKVSIQALHCPSVCIGHTRQA